MTMLDVELEREINLKVQERNELILRISQHRIKLPFIELETYYRSVKELEIKQEEQQLDELIKDITQLNCNITPITC